MSNIVEALVITLQNLSGKLVTENPETVVEALELFNAKYACIVTFTTTPSGATVVVKDATGTAVTKNSNGTFTLKEGSYTYDVSATNYVTSTGNTLSITNADETTGTKTVAVTALTGSTFTITYMDGVTPVVLTPNSYVYGTGVTLNDGSTVTTFDGWYSNAELTGDAVTAVGTTDYGNKTYYAKHTA